MRRAFTYPRVRSRIPLTDEQIASYVDDVRRNSLIVDPENAHLSTPIPCRDPDDVPIVRSAVAGHADVLCTLDRDIRREVVASWCLQFGIHILTDVELLHVLRTQKETDTD